MYNFDEIIEWRGIDSLKWDTVDDGVIPLWVADMDFPALPELREVLIKRASLPFYGYRAPLRENAPYIESIRSWYKSRHDLDLAEEDILSGPGTVLSLEMIVREFSAEGEGVLILSPVYTPFFNIIAENNRTIVAVFLEPDEYGRFVFDLHKIEDALERAGVPVPLALFCSPHNPGGRVWTKEEITAFLELAQQWNMITAFDEIHGDLVYGKDGRGNPQRFVSAASFREHAERVLTVSGANKTFNLGGLHISHFLITDEYLRRTIQAALYRQTHHEGDIFAEPAVETVFRHGAGWLDELLSYLENNIHTAVTFLNGNVPGIKAFIPDGTYLIWAEVREIIEKSGCKDDIELAERLENEAKVKISAGSIYGRAGAGFIRINAACPRTRLMEGLGRIRDWCK